jgi:hypothetical protein
VEMQDVKEEEKKLKENKQEYLRQNKRLKENVVKMEEEMIQLRHSQEFL